VRRSAPAKINLGLAVGPRREDGRHELLTVMQAITLCDELEISDADGADSVVCPGVEGENLAARALSLFRERSGWDGPGQLLRIDKHIPVAAGLGGGSSDAAASLALIAARAGTEDETLVREVATDLGADVPALLSPGRWLARGAGEKLRALPSPVGLWVLVLPAGHGLSTAAVYDRADSLGIGRASSELDALARKVHDELAGGTDLPPADLMRNDLEAAAISLAPSIARSLERVRAIGADHAMVAGSGPTVVGLFAGVAARQRCAAAARALNDGGNPALWAQAM